MSTLASLRILLGLDSGDVSKGAARVRGDLQGVKREANLARDAMRGVAAGFGLGAGLTAFGATKRVVQEFTDLLGDSVKAAIAEEAGIKRLDQSLKANVAGWDGNRAAIERVIEARQALGFADDEQRDAMARALAATNDVARAQDILATAMDLARLKGIDLGSATDALIKIEGGQFRALKALGIELRDGATQTEALAAVQRVAAGQAEEFAGTTAGAMAAAGIEVENLKEDFGALLAGPVKDLAGFLRTDLIPAIRDVAKFLGEAGTAAGGFAGEVTDLLDPSEELLNTQQQNILAAIKSGTAFDNAGVAAAEAGKKTLEYVAAEREAQEASQAAAQGSKAAAQEINDLGLTAQATAFYISRDLAASLNDLPREVNIDINVRTRTDAGLGVAERIAALNDSPLDTAGAQFTLDQIERERQAAEDRQRERDRVTADNRRRSDTAASDAKREADRRSAEDARRRADAQADADRAAKDRAREYFDQLHDMNLKAIDDIRDRANEELSAQQKAIRGVVSAEQARVNAVRAREQENALRADVAGAGTDEERASAMQDLNRFLEDQKIARMNSSADISIGLIDAEKARNDKIAADATAAENARAAAQRKSGVLPSVTATSPNATVPGVGSASSFTATIVNQFFVDGEKIVDVVERRQATLQAIYNPLPVSTGSQR